MRVTRHPALVLRLGVSRREFVACHYGKDEMKKRLLLASYKPDL